MGGDGGDVDGFLPHDGNYCWGISATCGISTVASQLLKMAAEINEVWLKMTATGYRPFFTDSSSHSLCALSCISATRFLCWHRYAAPTPVGTNRWACAVLAAV